MMHEMSDTTPSYADLRFEDYWIDDLRFRFPYSINRIESGEGGHPIISYCLNLSC